MPDSELPDGWSVMAFTDFAEVNPPRRIPTGRVAPFVEMAAVREGFRGVAYAGERVANGSGARFRNGDTIFARITPCAENGKVAFVDFLDGEAIGFGSTEFIVLAPRDGYAQPRYLYHLVASSDLHGRAISQMRGTSGRQRVPDDFFRQGLTVPIPPLPEQARIAGVLDSIDAAIEKTEAVIEATERLRSALLHELLTRGVPGWHTEWKDVPGIGTIPACWQVVRLGEMLERIEAGRSPACENRSAAPGEWGVLKVSAVSWEEFHSEENKALPIRLTPNPALEVKPGDLLVSRANTPELVGRSVLVEATRPRLLLCDKTLRLVPRRERTNGVFLRVLLATTASRRQIEGSATGTSRSMRNISQEALRSLAVTAPPLDEQLRITELATSLRERCGMEKRLLDMLRLSKQIAASVLLSGRVRVGARK